MISLPELLKAAENATPGPWTLPKFSTTDKEIEFNGPDGLTLDYDDVDHETQAATALHIALANPATIKTLVTSLQRAIETVRHYSCLNCQNGEVPCYDYTSCKTLREIKKEIERV